eukprot:574210-Alexandrium_andersonii.AAC.1
MSGRRANSLEANAYTEGPQALRQRANKSATRHRSCVNLLVTGRGGTRKRQGRRGMLRKGRQQAAGKWREETTDRAATERS